MVSVLERVSAAPGPSQIVGFSGYRPLTNREKERKVLTLSASTRCTEPIETAKYSVFMAGIRQSLSFTLNFASSSPAFSFSFSLPFSSFNVCRHIQRVHEFKAFFKISVL